VSFVHAVALDELRQSFRLPARSRIRSEAGTSLGLAAPWAFPWSLSERISQHLRASQSISEPLTRPTSPQIIPIFSFEPSIAHKHKGPVNQGLCAFYGRCCRALQGMPE
jgi:hypothetical protein